MKKYFSILIATGFILASCGGNANTPQDAPAADSTEIVTEETVATVDPAQALTDYKEFVDKFEKAVAGMNKGDAKAAIEYNNLYKKVATISTAAQEASASFTDAQKAEYTKLVEKYTGIIKAMNEKK